MDLLATFPRLRCILDKFWMTVVLEMHSATLEEAVEHQRQSRAPEDRTSLAGV
jgi:hypothetical protein